MDILFVFLFFVLVTLVVVFVYLIPIPLWIAAWSSDAYVGLANLVGMRFRRVPPSVIVNARISGVKAGLEIGVDDLESLYLAGGHVDSVVKALISADKAKIPMSFSIASGIDLAGRSVLDAVRMSVIPKVIETPIVAAVAKDGIQVMAKSRVTVRANMERLVGGAGEETVIARVGEGIVTTIGSSPSYKDMLENPDSISKTVLAKGLDAGTAFEILSIDIGDVDVGENIGARLQIRQALADKEIAQAKAESRRALAVAAEQEMKAKVQEMKAKVIEAEAQVPLAMAEAFRSGNLGIMDYYNIKNLAADTQMRESISKMGYDKGETKQEESPSMKHQKMNDKGRESK
ncbi:MAG: flotillin-like protein FloA [bacterium]